MSLTSEPVSGQPIWDMLGPRMPRGVLGLSDPDVHVIDDRWVMLIGGFSTSFRNRLYRARLPAGGVPEHGGWVFDRRPLVADPPKGAWDAGGMHTPSYVPPHDGHPARIYYAGRASSRHYGEGSAYAISALTLNDNDAWVRRETPVLRGGSGRASVLEPLVIAVKGGYRMWFLATPHEVGPGEQPDFELHVADSADGIDWETSRRFATTVEGFFDNAVYPTPQGWEMLLSRGTNLHGTTPYPQQGLWVMRAASPSPDRADWSPPERVLDTDAPGTPSWMGRGVWRLRSLGRATAWRATARVPHRHPRRRLLVAGCAVAGGPGAALACPGAVLPRHRVRRHCDVTEWSGGACGHSGSAVTASRR